MRRNKENLRIKPKKIRPQSVKNIQKPGGRGPKGGLSKPPQNNDPMEFYNWYVGSPHLWAQYGHPGGTAGQNVMGFICTVACNMGIVIYCDCKSDDNWIQPHSGGGGGSVNAINGSNQTLQYNLDPRDPHTVNQVTQQIVNQFQALGAHATPSQISSTLSNALSQYHNSVPSERGFIDLFTPCPCGAGRGVCAGSHTFGGGGTLSACVGIVPSINYTK